MNADRVTGSAESSIAHLRRFVAALAALEAATADKTPAKTTAAAYIAAAAALDDVYRREFLYTHSLRLESKRTFVSHPEYARFIRLSVDEFEIPNWERLRAALAAFGVRLADSRSTITATTAGGASSLPLLPPPHSPESTVSNAVHIVAPRSTDVDASAGAGAPHTADGVTLTLPDAYGAAHEYHVRPLTAAERAAAAALRKETEALVDKRVEEIRKEVSDLLARRPPQVAAAAAAVAAAS